VLYLKIFTAAWLALFLSGCAGERDQAPDMIVLNADVRTVDSTLPRAEAFAVSAGKFTAIGSSAEISALASETTQIINAAGVTIIPGLIDGHSHMISGASLATGVDLTDIADKQEWLSIISARAEALPRGAWILGGRWNHMLGDGVLPSKEMLDAVAPENPTLLTDIDGHSLWANSLAIRLAGITSGSRVPAGGEILVNKDTGAQTGIFLEGAARLFDGAPGLAAARDAVTGARAAVQMGNRLGLTGAHDMSGNMDAFLTVLREGNLTLRIWAGTFVTPTDDLAGQLDSMAVERERVRNIVAQDERVAAMGPLLEVGYVKMMIDGVLSTHTALMHAPYADRPTASPAPFISKDHLDHMVATVHDAGWPVAVHAIGDRGVSWVLDAFEASPRAADALMDRIEHVELVTDADIKRFGQLGIAASMQPHHATCCVGDYVIDRIGPERLDNAYAWRQMLDNGNHLVLGSDWSTSPFNPLIQMGDTLHRQTRMNGVVRPWDQGNTLTFDEALYGYTQAAADMTSWADEIGSISVGKWADFVILDQRITDPVGRSIADRTVTATYLAGQEIYQSK
jgi:predicted amidohydrolase YtcJ